jgi:spoIIIJ-associated protein
MNEQQRRYFSGETESQAVLEAAGHFGLEPGEVAYRRVEKKHGFLRRRVRVVIEVDPQAPRRSAETPASVAAAAAAPAATPAAAAPPAPATVPPAAAAGAAAERAPEEPRDDRRTVEEAVDLVLQLGVFEVDREVSAGDGEWRVDLSGEDGEWLLEEDGKLLSAVEHLVGRLLWQRQLEPAAVTVDCDGFRRRREEAIRERALAAARRVLDTGAPQTLEEMDPAERRIVHLAVEGLTGVTTESVGGGWRKRVEIRPD